MKLRLLSSLFLRQHSTQFVIARSALEVHYTLAKLSASFETNERRSNLPLLINWEEIFKGCYCENTPHQTQHREIASGMQQCLAESMLNTPSTEPRNGYEMKRSYEGWFKGREVRPLHKVRNGSSLTVEGKIYA